LRFGEHRVLGKQVLEGFRLKDTIRAIDSTGYNPKGGPKESVDQDSYHGLITESDSLRSFLLAPKGQISPAGYSRFHLVAVVVQQPNLPVQRAVLCQKERTFPREEKLAQSGLILRCFSRKNVMVCTRSARYKRAPGLSSVLPYPW
jgi:hypothetical protein